MPTLGRLGARVLDALLPPHCLICQAPVEAQGTLCPGCFAGLGFIGPPFCACCGVPFAQAGEGTPTPGGLRCETCLAAPPAFEAARAALRYDEAARALILPLKYADRSELAAPLARHMARAGAELLARADLIAPVPLHWRRLVQRSYNQAALLAAALGRLSGVPVVPDLLARVKATPPLESHGAAERALIVAEAFAVPPKQRARLAGRRVLLVDDVLTSGATANGCAQALRAGGAAAVDVLAAARVPDPRLAPEGAMQDRG